MDLNHCYLDYIPHHNRFGRLSSMHTVTGQVTIVILVSDALVTLHTITNMQVHLRGRLGFHGHIQTLIAIRPFYHVSTPFLLSLLAIALAQPDHGHCGAGKMVYLWKVNLRYLY